MQQPRPAETRSFGNDIDREKTLVVRDLRVGGAQTCEAAFETLQRNRSPEGFHPSFGGVAVCPVEMLREPFVEPRRNTGRSNACHNGVCQFMRQDFLEQLRL